MRDRIPTTLQPPATASSQLREAVKVAARRDARSMEILRAAVREFTKELRDGGATPEGVLVLLKSVINDRSLPVIPSAEIEVNGHQLRATLSTWCIEEYFNQKAPGAPGGA